MRIFIESRDMTFPLEVESYDTIYYVKGLIQEKEGSRRSESQLSLTEPFIPRGTFHRMDNSRTLADYNIEYDFTLLLLPILYGGNHVYIKTFPWKPFPVLVGWDTVDKLKARIEEKLGIPVLGQRLVFRGEELVDGGRTIEDYGVGYASTLRLVRVRGAGDDAVDIAAVQERRKAARKGIGNQAEIDLVRAGFSSRGSNCVEGEESFSDEDDFGLVWKRSRSHISPYDASGFESKSRRTLVESVAYDCARTQNVTTFPEYEDSLSRAEKEVKRLTDENARVKDEMKRLMEELVVERTTGASFLRSEGGRRHIVTVKRRAVKSAVNDFKKSAAFKEIVMNRSMSIYDDVVKECQRLLRQSGRVTEDIVQLLDCGQEEGEGSELNEHRSISSFFFETEVGRRHIVRLKRQAAKSGVEEFKESALFKEIVMNRAMSVYDDVVKECQRLLRKSGRVTEDIVQLLDHPGDEEEEEEELGNDDDDDLYRNLLLVKKELF